MKLIYYILVRISLALTVILTGWAIFFYIAVMDEVNDEVMMHLKTTRKLLLSVHWQAKNCHPEIQLPIINIS